MPKKSYNFSDIKIKNDHLLKVAKFKAIVAPGKKRPELSKESHQALVEKKYDHANHLKDHITLFRVNDKKGLPPKEITNHTVPGPEWTLPSSVGLALLQIKR